MDPVSLSITGLKAVSQIATHLLKKAEQVEKLRKRESRFARQYKKSIKELAEETGQIDARLNVTIEHGNSSAVAKLLKNDDGDDALQKLVTMLDHARVFILEQDEAADRMLEILAKADERNKIIDILGVDDEDAAFDLLMDDATSELKAHCSDLKRQYEHFNSLYVIFLAASESPPPRSHPESSDQHEDNRRDFQADIMNAFYNRPFRVTLSNAAAADIATDIDVVKSTSSSYISMMEQFGERWVERLSLESSEISVRTLAELQATILEKMLASIEFELAGYNLKSSVGEDEDNDSRYYKNLESMEWRMEKELKRIKSRSFSVAFCGMVKAGKSLFLNALTGQDLLPSDDLPATAWPCRLLHIRGQKEPTLTLDPRYFQTRIRELRMKGNGKLMKDYDPPVTNDDYEDILNNDSNSFNASEGPSSDRIRKENEKREIYMNWVDLHIKTKMNLLRFEEPNFTIPDEAVGAEEVIDLLTILNDVIRLCGRFGIQVDKPKNKPDAWPLLKVEFETLRDVLDSDSGFEFIDLPGIGESGSEFHEFQDLVRDVAKNVNAVVPVVSLKEVPRNAWRTQLPGIVNDGLRRSPDLVLCTHLDHAKDRLTNLVSDVAKLFYPKLSSDDGRNRVISCATRMGTSARSLMRISDKSKPSFSDFWNKDSILYDCAVKVLGDWKSEARYRQMDIGVWKRLLQDQLDRSGFPSSTRRLIKDMVVSSHKRILEIENSAICKQINAAIEDQFSRFVRMRRSREDYVKAHAQFLVESEKYRKVLVEWEGERSQAQPKFVDKLQERFDRIEADSTKSIDGLIDGIIEKFRSMGKLAPSSDHKGSQMTFPSPSDAELFLFEVQREGISHLNKAKKDFVDAVRALALRAHGSYFKSLRDKIKKQLSDDKYQAALKNEIIEELSEKGASIEELAFHNIKQKVMHTVAVRHTGASAYRSIKEAIAKPFLKQRPVDAFLNAHKTAEDSDKLNATISKEASRGVDSSRRSVDDLGFMLRAPITVVASLSWLLGSGVWPFMTQSQKIVMDKHEFIEQMQAELLAKFFTNLQMEGQGTLVLMINSSWSVAKSIVEDELKGEKERYDSEERLKGKPVSEEKLAATLALLLNFVAARSALTKLRTDLQQVLV